MTVLSSAGLACASKRVVFYFFEESAAGNQSNGQAFVIWFANRIRQKRPTSCSRWVGRLKRKLSKHFQFLFYLKKIEKSLIGLSEQLHLRGRAGQQVRHQPPKLPSCSTPVRCWVEYQWPSGLMALQIRVTSFSSASRRSKIGVRRDIWSATKMNKRRGLGDDLRCRPLAATDDRKTKFFFSANHWRPFRCRTSGCAFFRPQPKGVRDGRLQSRHLLHSGCCYLPKREKYLHSDASSGPSVW